MSAEPRNSNRSPRTGRDGRGRLAGVASNRSGYALLAVIIISFVLSIVGLAFLAMAGYETRASEQDADSQRAFWLAEAGRERAMKWMTDQNRPPEFDQTIFTNVAGPDGGSYSVTCRVDTAGLFEVEKAFMLESLGDFDGRQRKIRHRIKMISFAQYGYYTVSENGAGGGPIWFANGNVIEGLIHSNGVIRIRGNPQFLGRVTSAQDYMIGSVNFVVTSPAGWPVGGNNPYFSESFELSVDSIPLPSSTNDLRNAALTEGGIYTPFATTIELGKRASDVAAPGWLRYRNTAIPLVWLERQISTLEKAVFYSDGEIQVSGVLDGELTVSSANDVVIIDDLLYAASDTTGRPLPGCNDLMGIVAEEDIVFANIAPQTDNLKINSVLMALNTSIAAEDYAVRDTCGTLTIWGGLIQQRRGAVGTINGSGDILTGYIKDYHYDPRVTARTPPEFPLTGVYENVAWAETWDVSDPF